GVVHLVILWLSGGSWMGPLSLRKAATFGLSFGITLINVIWVAARVPLRARTRSILLIVFTAACVLETTLVSMQAWRGVASHFNMETPFDAIVARTLAVGGAALVAVIATLTFASFRPNPLVPAHMRVAIRAGLALLLGAQIVGGAMIARGMMLVVSGDP